MIFESFPFIIKHFKIRICWGWEWGGQRIQKEGKHYTLPLCWVLIQKPYTSVLPQALQNVLQIFTEKPLPESTVLLSLPLPPPTTVLHAGPLGFFACQY